MTPFDEIYARAAARKGGDAALEALLAPYRPKTPAQIAQTPDDRLLSAMSRHVFQAGFSWKVIENKWPGFEAAFEGFDPRRCALMSDETFDALLRDKRIVRNAQKILSVQKNARFLLDLAEAHGAAAQFFADWPDADYIGLLEVLRKRGSRLGAASAMYLLRAVGKPSFILSADVTAALIQGGVLGRPPSGKRDRQAIQAAFNAWSEQSGRDLTAISRVLAMSIGA
jgi:3-methyladenine DNA glycosylase Tag